MYIHEAVELAMKSGKHIALETLPGIKILPTNGIDCCVVKEADGSRPCRGWEPQADDLMSDKWKIVD